MRFEYKLNNIDNIAKQLINSFKNKIVIFQCAASYPCEDIETNLNVLQTYRDMYNLNIGVSDDTLGTELALVSVGFGCRYIEKHFTLDKKSKGPDHATSLDYNELKYLIVLFSSSLLLIPIANK